MRVVSRYSHKGAAILFEDQYQSQLQEVVRAIEWTRAEDALTKSSREITMAGRTLYSPVALNKAIKSRLYALGWAEADKSRAGKFSEPRVYLTTVVPETGRTHRGYRAMDGIKGRVGLEIQFGKYAFMGYDILAKMVIFHRRGLIDVGIEVVPMKSLATGSSRVLLVPTRSNDQDATEQGTDPADAVSLAAMARMSTGVSYFEQITADLEARSAADLDIPVLVMGIDV